MLENEKPHGFVDIHENVGLIISLGQIGLPETVSKQYAK